MFFKYRATCCAMSVEPSSYASVTARSVPRQNCIQCTISTSFHYSVNKMAVSAHRCHFSLTSFSVSLLCNLILSAYSKADTYISHESESFMILWPWMNFFNHITNFRKGCPMWLFKVLLRSLVFFVCTPPVSWASLILPAKLLWKLASHAKKSKLWKLRKSFSSLLFSAVSSTDI